MNTELMFSSKNQCWETPKRLFDQLNNEFHFTLDPCSSHENHKCDNYYTIEDDGLSQDWSGEIVFVNPPYGGELKLWVKKCFEEWTRGTTIVMLIPARTDTQYFHEYILPCAEIRFLKGRIKFEQNGIATNPAPFPSMIVIYK